MKIGARKKHNNIEYKGMATFYYIWDMDNLLARKDSPFDKGKEVFEQLYKHRIKVR